MPKYITRTQVKRGTRLSAVNNGRGVPYDIVAYIAGFLWDDMISLKNATLLSHSWRAASFSYLFRRVRINGSGYLATLHDLLDEGKIQGAWVRELRLPYITFPLVDKAPGWVSDACSSLPSKLTHLYTLTIGNLECARRATETPEGISEDLEDHIKILSRFGSVKELNIESTRCPSWVTWATTSAFPNLKNLQIWNQWSFIHIKDPSPDTIRNVSLSSLHFSDSNHRYFHNAIPPPFILDFALQSPTKESLRSLSINLTSSECYSAAINFLQCVGPRLTDLEINLSENILLNYKGMMVLWPPKRSTILTRSCAIDKLHELNLGRCVALKTMTLYNPNKRSTLDLVNQLSPIFSRLHWILLEIRFDSPTAIPENQCKKMDERLSQPDAQAIREIAFRYEGKVELGKAKRKIRRLFPSVAAQGNMEVF